MSFSYNELFDSNNLDIDSILKNNIEKILNRANNNIANKNYKIALKILKEAIIDIQNETLISSKTSSELQEKILNSISDVLFQIEDYEECYINDKLVFNNFLKNI